MFLIFQIHSHCRLGLNLDFLGRQQLATELLQWLGAILAISKSSRLLSSVKAFPDSFSVPASFYQPFWSRLQPLAGEPHCDACEICSLSASGLLKPPPPPCLLAFLFLSTRPLFHISVSWTSCFHCRLWLSCPTRDLVLWNSTYLGEELIGLNY